MKKNWCPQVHRINVDGKFIEFFYDEDGYLIIQSVNGDPPWHLSQPFLIQIKKLVHYHFNK